MTLPQHEEPKEWAMIAIVSIRFGQPIAAMTKSNRRIGHQRPNGHLLDLIADRLY